MSDERKTTIIGISGRKTSGKTSASNFIFSIFLYFLGLSESAKINEEGQLVVVSDEGEGVLDLTNPDAQEWLTANLYPHIKRYSVADALKAFAMDYLGLSYESCYGSNEQKNAPTHLLWEDMPTAPHAKKVHNRKGPMSGREVLEYWGTEIMREMNPNIHIDSLLRRIEKDKPEFIVLDDVRYENEVLAIQKAGGFVVRLSRVLFPDDTAKPEVALDNFEGFDYVVDNTALSMQQTHEKLVEILTEKGIIQTEKADS
jgi:hypothetical protein